MIFFATHLGTLSMSAKSEQYITEGNLLTVFCHICILILHSFSKLYQMLFSKPFTLRHKEPALLMDSLSFQTFKFASLYRTFHWSYQYISTINACFPIVSFWSLWVFVYGRLQSSSKLFSKIDLEFLCHSILIQNIVSQFY